MTTESPAKPLTLSATEAAEKIGAPRRWLMEQARADRVPCVRFSHNSVRFTEEQIAEIIRAHTRSPDALQPHAWGQTPASERRTRRRAG